MAEIELDPKAPEAAKKDMAGRWFTNRLDDNIAFLRAYLEALRTRPSVSEDAVEALLPVLCTAYSCGYTDRPGDRDWSDNIDRLTTDLRAALTALPNTGDGVGVRELEWPEGEPKTRLRCRATGPYCYTIVRAGENVYRWACTDVWVRADAAPAGHSPDGRWSEICTTLDEAKAAAQADYETRIRSVLTNGGQS